MLFTSVEFLFVFLPLTLIGYYLAGLWSHRLATLSLLGCSLGFYAWWSPLHLLLLVASVLTNYGIGNAITSHRAQDKPAAYRMFTIGVIFNLSLLGFFKYYNFFISNLNELNFIAIPHIDIILPLAISFYTFQQIAHLWECRSGEAMQYSLPEYALFITFFPHLIAGPITRPSEMLRQFHDPMRSRWNGDAVRSGFLWFILGLAKKMVLADQFGTFADTAFARAATGHDPSFFEAWGAALCYTFQLYFDFSGYSEMAIGLGMMFGIFMPLNFNSPYKSVNISEFWRRWHMTLSRFLRDFVYIPLGGNRMGEVRRNVNLMATMLIGGLWHGAGWTFVIWGGMHGAFLVVHRLWTLWRGEGTGRLGARILGVALTFLCVVFAWVMFRADHAGTAVRIWSGMIGLNGAVLPDQLLGVLPMLRRFVTGLPSVPELADGTLMGTFEMFALILLGMGIAWFGRNLPELSGRGKLILVVPAFALVLQRVLFAVAPSSFLYFQF